MMSSPENRPFPSSVLICRIIAIFSLPLLFFFPSDLSPWQKRSAFEFQLSRLHAHAPADRQEGSEEIRGVDEPGMAAFHDYLVTLDPATGKVPAERLLAAETQARAMRPTGRNRNITWQSYAADMGGRTRALMYDPNDPTGKKVWAGGVTGGLWYNPDITSSQSSWVPVGDFWNNLAIRCLAYDPQEPQTFFVGSGEAETALQTYRESSGVGFGIARSDDGGETWYHIDGTEQFVYVTDIAVRIENSVSVIYAGVASGLYKGSQQQSQPSDGLFRSADGGSTWQQVLPLIAGSTVPYCVSDIALGADNRLYAGTRPNLDGEGGAVILWSDNGTTWNVVDQFRDEILATPSANIPGRVVLGTSPASADVVYALIASGYVNPGNGFNYFNCNHILRSADKGVSWVKKNLPTNLTSGTNFATIAWHALDIGVDPNNPDWLYIGGLDAHKSFNGGITWLRVSDWSKMYSGGGPDYLHADQHAVVFKPGSSDQVLFATDGGVFYTSDGSATVPYFAERNHGFNTLQVYTCALHPQAGFNQFYGGLQDNGTLLNLGLGDPLTINDMVSGGDGAACFFDQEDPSLSITSIYYNQYYIYDNLNYQNYAGNWSSGTFISPADFDYKLKHLYCNAVDYLGNHAGQILRLSNLRNNPTGKFVNIISGTTAFFSAVRYSPHSPSGSTTLYAGTESGRLFRIEQAQSNTPVVEEIGATSFPLASISSVAIGKTEDILMVTFSNYGVESVYQTTNGGTTWQTAEGNLPDMPVRWAVYHPQNDRQALVATETGVWECVDLAAGTPKWKPVNEGMANVRTDMLQVRKSDNTVLAATHGRGFFTMTWDVSTGTGQDTPPNFMLAPNPTNGILFLQSERNGPRFVSVSVTSAAGAGTALTNTDLLPGTTCRIDLRGNKPGQYLVRVKMENGAVFTRKVVLL